MGVTKPHGTSQPPMERLAPRPVRSTLGYGGKKWGNFIEFDGLNTGRFLDPPEFAVFHDKGNEQNIFDRVDYQFTAADSVHLNLTTRARGSRRRTPMTT